MSDPFVRSFWANLGGRLLGQARQVSAPVLMSASSMSGTIDLRATGAVLGVALALTVVKVTLQELSGITVPRGAPWWRVAADRALPAGAGVLLGYVPSDLTGIVSTNWHSVGVAAAASAVLALLDYKHADAVAARKEARRTARHLDVDS